MEKDFSERTLLPFMIGVYLAINALRDAYLLVEGPNCVYLKTTYIQGNQDYLSTITNVNGLHRVANTNLHPSKVILPREEVIKSILIRMASYNGVDNVMLTSMPLAFITGVDYERICKEVANVTNKEIIHIPGKSLSNDWLGGYEETLKAIATQIKIEKGKPKDNNVAIVGYLFDRNEEDNKGNIRELNRMLNTIGLNLVSVWLGGQNFNKLKDIKDAATIISFPYGKEAAQILATRLGVRLIETDLPFGLTATERWLRKLGEIFGKETDVEKFIDNELKDIIPKLEWVVPFLFHHRSFGYIGDCHLLPGFVGIIELLGGKVKFAIITNCRYHVNENNLKNKVDEILIEERSNTIKKFLNHYIHNNKIHCIVTNHLGLELIPLENYSIVEFGFPSYYIHALYDRPYLGFAGFLAFIDTVANQIRFTESINRQ